MAITCGADQVARLRLGTGATTPLTSQSYLCPTMSLRYLSLAHDLSDRMTWLQERRMEKFHDVLGALRVEASFGDESGVTRRRGSRGCSTAGSARRLRAGFRSMRCSGWSRNSVPAAFVERRTPRRSARAVADRDRPARCARRVRHPFTSPAFRGQRAGHRASGRGAVELARVRGASSGDSWRPRSRRSTTGEVVNLFFANHHIEYWMSQETSSD